ncbi:MAG: hypothetical protein KDC84_05365 [Crocinitomicaceae bacterium]|nr:hypothetical protein [Crocinitomicaceae bacterium]
MKSITLILVVFLVVIGANGFSQGFGYSGLLFSSEGVALKSRELPKYEYLNINVTGIQGFVPIENMASLGMEVRVTDANDQQIMYSPDMFDGNNIPIEKIPTLDFNFGLSDEFEVGQTYFLSVRLWDRNSNQEMTKDATIKVLEPIENKNAEINAKSFEVETVKFYLNKNRYYSGNLIRQGDELYIDIFLKEVALKQKAALNYSVFLIEESTEKMIPIESDVLAVTDPDQLRVLNYTITLAGDKIQPGKKYTFQVKFSMEELNASLDLKYHFQYLKPGMESNEDVQLAKDFQVYLNREEVAKKIEIFPGDRIDLQMRNLNSVLTNEYNTNRIGGILILEDGKGKEITRSEDLFKDYEQVGTEKTSDISMHWNAVWDVEENAKYKLKAIIWDKYSNKRFENSFEFKAGKVKSRPYGIDLNPSAKLEYDANKVDPASIYVLVNGYKHLGNELKPGDVVFLKVGSRKKEGVNTEGFKTVIQVQDLDGNIISENIERIPTFSEGEVYATITIPYNGEEIGKSFKLVCKIMDLHEMVINSSFVFKVVR